MCKSVVFFLPFAIAMQRFVVATPRFTNVIAAFTNIKHCFTHEFSREFYRNAERYFRSFILYTNNAERYLHETRLLGSVLCTICSQTKC